LTGISLIKENAIASLANLSEVLKENFIPYYDETMRFLINAL
jgi:hypothetical protein